MAWWEADGEQLNVGWGLLKVGSRYYFVISNSSREVLSLQGFGPLDKSRRESRELLIRGYQELSVNALEGPRAKLSTFSELSELVERAPDVLDTSLFGLARALRVSRSARSVVKSATPHRYLCRFVAMLIGYTFDFTILIQ